MGVLADKGSHVEVFLHRESVEYASTLWNLGNAKFNDVMSPELLEFGVLKKNSSRRYSD
jgi:hypothetical protein